jgi:hypothetical protein
MIKFAELERGDIVSITGAVANSHEEQRAIVPAWKRGMSNYTGYLNAGNDDMIGFPHGYGVDGNLVIHAAWSSGLGIFRVNNDGSFTKIYGNSDPSGAYGDANNQSVVLHKDLQLFVIMSYDNNGYSIWDYSDCFNGNAPTLEESGGTFIDDGAGLTIEDVGSSYYSGLTIAGDWVYAVDEGAEHYKAIGRRNLRTGVSEKVDFTTDKRTGSATIDRNGYRGTVFYDSVNDRVFYCTYYNANMTVIYDASTADPKAVWCDMGDAGLGDDAYEQGIYIPDPTNYPNKLVVGCNSRHAHVDITNCLSGGAVSVLGQMYTEDGANGSRFGNYFRAGVQEQDVTTNHTERNPSFSDFCPTSPDRGRNMLDGWLDLDNYKIVGVYRHDSTTEDTTTGGRGRSYRSDYGAPIFRVRSTDGTYWWVKLGYGYDGHKYWSWSNDIGNGLIGNWEIIYGTYTLDNSANVDFVHLETLGHQTPSGCSFSYYVSNNNGSTWETYNASADGYHMFSSSGTQLRVKYSATGQSDKAPYKMSSSYDVVSYGSLYESVKDATIPYKVTRKKIRGKKS